MQSSKESIVIVWLLFTVVLLLISLNDFLFFRIENEYILALMVLYIIACVYGISGNNLPENLIIATAVTIVSMILCKFDLLGGGDVKMLFPLILFAENQMNSFVMGVSIGGLIVAVVYFFAGRKIFFFRRKIIFSLKNLYKNRNKSILLNFTLLSFNRMTRRSIELDNFVFDSIKQEIPYGIALSCGGICVVVENLVAR